MTSEFLILLRRWVMAEAEYACASREADADGYRYSAYSEKRVADELFEELLAKVEDA